MDLLIQSVGNKKAKDESENSFFGFFNMLITINIYISSSFFKVHS